VQDALDPVELESETGARDSICRVRGKQGRRTVAWAPDTGNRSPGACGNGKLDAASRRLPRFRAECSICSGKKCDLYFGVISRICKRGHCPQIPARRSASETDPQRRCVIEYAFVRAILAAPHDAAPRLMYADWLEERGDPRGEYLRLRHALDGMAPKDPTAATEETLRPHAEAAVEEFLDAEDCPSPAEERQRLVALLLDEARHSS
jgi:uncharacterized protein (TIGR02996 family)